MKGIMKYNHEIPEQSAISTIKKYNLLSKKEKILLALSGGKDSTSLAYIMKKHGYEFEAIHLDMGIRKYSKECRKSVENFCKTNSVKLHIIDFAKEGGKTLPDILKNKKCESPCRICGMLKRRIMNERAIKLKADVLVTGHNLDDACQSILMNIFRSSISSSLVVGPKTGTNSSGGFVPRVKPLYFCSERDIENYAKKFKLGFRKGICPLSRDAYRRDIKNALDVLEKSHPGTKENIVRNFLKLVPELRKNLVSKK